jgi:hypothetical protein
MRPSIGWYLGLDLRVFVLSKWRCFGPKFVFFLSDSSCIELLRSSRTDQIRKFINEALAFVNFRQNFMPLTVLLGFEDLMITVLEGIQLVALESRII